MVQPFHLAIPVDDLEAARQFYGSVLGCPQGREDTHWIDYNFFGHQLVVHLSPSTHSVKNHNEVDGKFVPVPHFGVVLNWDQFHNLVTRLRDREIKFVIEPYVRFEGKAGEQATMFFYDPAGNAIEFKAFRDISQLFAT